MSRSINTLVPLQNYEEDIASMNSSAIMLAKFFDGSVELSQDVVPFDNIESSSQDHLPPMIWQSDEMHIILAQKFNANIGCGMWHDHVASTLTCCLDSNSVYNSTAAIINTPGAAPTFEYGASAG